MAIVVGLLAAGCGCSTAPQALPTGTSNQTLSVGGVQRTYQLTLPASVRQAPAGSVTLVVGLHGGLGSGSGFASIAGFPELAQRKGFAFAAPDGRSLPSALGRSIRTWNAGRCCGPAVAKNVDDVAYIGALVSELRARVPAIGKVALVGHSNGAMLAWRIACERPSTASVYVPVAGSFEGTAGCAQASGASLLAIHGDADENHPIDGGTGSRSISGVSYRSMAESLSTWRAARACPGTGTTKVSGPLRTTTWSCTRATSRYTVIAGADHPWPGSTGQATGLQGTPSTAMDATIVAWDFIRTH
ncbi:MAG: hypothetical protein R2754_14355 [Microthrixaceae bacterium]